MPLKHVREKKYKMLLRVQINFEISACFKRTFFRWDPQPRLIIVVSCSLLARSLPPSLLPLWSSSSFHRLMTPLFDKFHLPAERTEVKNVCATDRHLVVGGINIKLCNRYSTDVLQEHPCCHPYLIGRNAQTSFKISTAGTIPSYSVLFSSIARSYPP